MWPSAAALEHFMRMNGRAAERLEFSPTPSEDVRMRFTVRHETIYRYSAPVSLSPHLLRLNPRAEGATILERSLTVDPKPIAFREETDRFGNRVTHLDFEGFSDRLRIESRFDLETVAPEPFAGLGALPLPWAGTTPPIQMPFFFEAAILSRMSSPVTSRSNWAKDKSTFRVSCPMLVVVLNAWVTETNDT
jgi:transglutaminase-like putative cysteine protease